MFDFHSDKQRYFNIQKTVTQEDIIPFLEKFIGTCKDKHVLEVGCAEAGVLKAFLDGGNTGVGVELSTSRFDSASNNLSDEIASGRATIINKNIYDITDPFKEFGKLFDIIILKDVIEHIPDQEKFIQLLKKFLATNGVIFFAYPPWWMPFGGHQQICKSKWLRTLPWFHLLPTTLYKKVLGIFKEHPATIKELLEIKETGINIGKMHRIIKDNSYQIVDEVYWFTNPIYKFKFGLKKRQLPSFLTRIPVLVNFYTTAHYVLFKK